MAPTPTEPTTKRNEEAIINRALEALDMRDDLNARSSNTNNHSHTNNLSRGGGRDGLFASPNANGGERNKMRVEKQRRSFLSRIAAKKKGANTEARGVIKEEKAKQSKEVERDTDAATASSISTSTSWVGISQKVKNQLREVERKFGVGGVGGVGSGGGVGGNGQKVTDKSDRATVEQALDPRTRMILFKMLSREVFSEINGCVSTGKEANVYHAVRVIEVEEEVEEEEVEVERVVPAQRREVRQSTTDKTVLSAEKRQQYVRGIAENSKKRKALTEQLESATIPLDDIFGEDDKEPWKEHPKYQDLEVKAKKYVDSLGYSQPNKGASETMHTMAKKLDICLPRSKTPAKPVLTHAIVVQKLRHVDTTAGLKYE